MIGVTFFGLLLTPVFYVVVRWITGHRRKAGRVEVKATAASDDAQPQEVAHAS